MNALISHQIVSTLTSCRLLHRGRGREITAGQRIHASLAFRALQYTPKASFSSYKLEWTQIVGKGNTTDLSWAKGLDPFLEMDIFDTTSALKLVIDELKDDVKVKENLGHLHFISLSGE